MLCGIDILLISSRSGGRGGGTHIWPMNGQRPHPKLYSNPLASSDPPLESREPAASNAAPFPPTEPRPPLVPTVRPVPVLKMLFHDRGTVNIADVVRYVVTYDPALDPGGKHRLLSHIASAGHVPGLLHPALHLRVRNNASMLLRAAYLQGPYILCVSVRENTFHANNDDLEPCETSAPVYDQDVKASTSFWTELPADRKYGNEWVCD